MRETAGLRVLLVEDEPIVAVLAEDLLDAIGCNVTATVTTVSAGLAAVASLEFDLAMIDINLDGEDGLAVADALRARGTPYLITTGYDAHRAAPEHPAGSILTKPYTMADLEKAVRRCMAARR